MGAIKNGLRYARDGKGASQSKKDKYLIPWNTKEKSITGGGIFIGSSYINVGQSTIYLQKFDVNNDRSNNLFSHQYMTNVLAPYSEAKSIYNGYKKSGLLELPRSFIIPVYDNMPSLSADNPNIKRNEFVEENTKVYCNGDRVNVRTGPSTSYEIITTVNSQDHMTRILKGTQNGEKWDKVILENGIVGYIYQTYVTEVPRVLNIISGIGYDENTVADIKNKITTDLEIEIVNYQNKPLQDDDLIGTGSKIYVKENGQILKEYQIIIYGDADGDGRINSLDLLVLQRHILEIEKLAPIFQKACNLDKTGGKPTSIDLLLMQRHILELQIIEQ